jgi:LmbE family N-acetylglucosaminyl deacetylase
MEARYDAAVLAQRKQQAKAVASVLGLASSRFLDLEDETLEQELTRTIAAIEDCMLDVRPQVVYTHHGGDSNQDHRGVFLATVVAARSYTELPLQRILCYETPSATEQAPPFPHYAFVPNYYVDISSTLSRKIEAMKIYEDELRDCPHPRSIEGITTLATYRGMAAGCVAAEAFMLYREVLR